MSQRTSSEVVAAAPPNGVGRPDTPSSAGRRIDMFDGLRGIALVLVVLSHGWQLWPVDWIDSHDWVRPFFRNGNAGVSVFLLAAGFLMYRSLTTRGELTAMRPDTLLVRRVTRVGPSLWLFLLVSVIVSTLDSSTDAWHADTSGSVFHVLTYTWNWYVQGNLLNSRPDYGHLWYLSVDMQAFVIIAALCYLMRRHRLGLVAALGAFYLVLLWWRFHVLHTEFIFSVLVRTTVRMDPFVVGVLAAALLPELARLRTSARGGGWVATGSLVALVPILFWCDQDSAYLRWGGTVLEWDLAAFFVAVTLGGTSGPVARVTGNRIVTWLGRHTLLLYIWHYEVFTFVARHTKGPSWSWEVRALVAIGATFLVTWVCDLLLERRVTRFLKHPGWRSFDQGMPHGLAGFARGGARRALSRLAASGTGTGTDSGSEPPPH